MTFDVLVLPDIFKNLPPTFRDYIKAAIRNLNDPFPGTGKGGKKEIKGADDVAYRLRVGSFRIFYRIDKENRIVYVFDILTAEQAHKKYGRFRLDLMFQFHSSLYHFVGNITIKRIYYQTWKSQCLN